MIILLIIIGAGLISAGIFGLLCLKHDAVVGVGASLMMSALALGYFAPLSIFAKIEVAPAA